MSRGGGTAGALMDRRFWGTDRRTDRYEHYVQAPPAPPLGNSPPGAGLRALAVLTDWDLGCGGALGALGWGRPAGQGLFGFGVKGTRPEALQQGPSKTSSPRQRSPGRVGVMSATPPEQRLDKGGLQGCSPLPPRHKPVCEEDSHLCPTRWGPPWLQRRPPEGRYPPLGQRVEEVALPRQRAQHGAHVPNSHVGTPR